MDNVPRLVILKRGAQPFNRIGQNLFAFFRAMHLKDASGHKGFHNTLSGLPVRMAFVHFGRVRFWSSQSSVKIFARQFRSVAGKAMKRVLSFPFPGKASVFQGDDYLATFKIAETRRDSGAGVGLKEYAMRNAHQLVFKAPV